MGLLRDWSILIKFVLSQEGKKVKGIGHLSRKPPELHSISRVNIIMTNALMSLSPNHLISLNSQQSISGLKFKRGRDSAFLSSSFNREGN